MVVAGPVKQVSGIDSEGRALSSQGEMLHKMALELGERLAPVLHPNTPLAPAPDAKRPIPDVPLVDQLLKINDELKWTIQVLGSILERLDLP